MHGVPDVRAVPGVAGESPLLCQRDQHGQEAGTVARAMRDIGDPHDRRPHPLLGQADNGGFDDIAHPQGAPVLIVDEKGRVLLGGRTA